MRSLMRGDPEFVVRWAWLLLLVAMLLGFLCARLEIAGIFTCAFLGALGAGGGMLVQYRTDRGLWMLAALFLVIYCGLYVLFFVGQLGDVLRNAGQAPVGVVVDFSVATLLLSANIRFLFRIARFNWSISRENLDAQP